MTIPASVMADIVQSLIIMARRSENLLPASFFEAKTVPVSLVNVLPQLRHIHLPRPWPLTDGDPHRGHDQPFFEPMKKSLSRGIRAAISERDHRQTIS